MRDHPIPPVTEPLQYRAIGIVRGIYTPEDSEKLTRGHLLDANGVSLEAVVLGRILTLMRRHLDIESPHLWVVYPRCRDCNHLHLQIAGIWEPSTLTKGSNEKNVEDSVLETSRKSFSDQLPEGDDYFSIRGELIYTKPDAKDFVVKVRQRPRKDGRKPIPFKLQLKGEIPLENLRSFISLDVRRKDQQLHLEKYDVIASMPTRGGKRKSGKQNFNRSVESNNQGELS